MSAGSEGGVLSRTRLGPRPRRQVIALSATVGTFMQGKQLTPGTLAAWGAMRAPLDRLAQAYGM